MSRQQPTTHVHVDPLDLREAIGILEKVLEGLRELDGVTPPQPSGNAPGSGDMARRLLNYADQSTYAGSVIRNQYWTWKGGVAP